MGQPSFLIFQPCFHRCSRCGHRQEHFAPFKRKKVMYTDRFEGYVLWMLIGSNEEEVAQRLGIAAETVALYVAAVLPQGLGHSDQNSSQVVDGSPEIRSFCRANGVTPFDRVTCARFVPRSRPRNQDPVNSWVTPSRRSAAPLVNGWSPRERRTLTDDYPHWGVRVQ